MADETPRDGTDASPDNRETDRTNRAAASDRWLPDDDGPHAPLPRDLQDALGRLFGRGPVATMAEWAAEVRAATGGDSVRVRDLCHSDEPTGHYGRTGGDTYHFQCFYDAVVLAALTDDAVDVHTESPGGTVVEATVEAGGGVVSTDPPNAVVSFGVGDDVESPTDGGPTHGDVYAGVCPYVRAFSDQSAYREWAADVPAATVATSLSTATAFTGALVGDA